jgi:transglutaminase-like putative cysteine protease
MLQALLLFLSTFSVQARWASPKDVGSVLQEYSSDIQIAADGSTIGTYEQIWRIQTEEGKVNGSVREIEYNAFSDKVEVLQAQTKNGKEVIPVAPTAIEDRDKGESRDYDPVKVKSLVYPKVSVGSELILKYRIKSSPAPIPGRFSLKFIFPIGIRVEKLKATYHSELPIVYQLNDPDEILRVRAQKNRLTAELKKVIPGQVVGEKDPVFFQGRMTSLIITTEADWKKYFAPLVIEFNKIIEEPMPAELEKELKAWRKIKNPEAQLTEVLQYMSRQFRYFGDWRRVRGGFVPRHLSEIEKSRYGDCKDLSTLLAAILKQLGYQAHVSLVERGISNWLNKPVDKIANSGDFNHAITRAQKDGKTWWLDPTNAVVALTPFADIAGKVTFLLSPASENFERIPGVAPEQYVYDDVENYEFLPSGDVKVRVEAKYRNQAAFRLEYGFLNAPRDKILFDIVDYYSEGQDLKDFKFLQASASPESNRELRDQFFDFVYWTPSVSYQSSLGFFLPIRDGVLSGAFYETQGRESDLQLAEMPLIHHSKKILKKVRGLGEPSVCEIKSPWMDLKREITYNKSDIEITQEAIVRIPVIQKKEYASEAFIKLRNQARKCFYRTGLIFKTL